jgi:hypothetical protein
VAFVAMNAAGSEAGGALGTGELAEGTGPRVDAWALHRPPGAATAQGPLAGIATHGPLTAPVVQANKPGLCATCATRRTLPVVPEQLMLCSS